MSKNQYRQLVLDQINGLTGGVSTLPDSVNDDIDEFYDNDITFDVACKELIERYGIIYKLGP